MAGIFLHKIVDHKRKKKNMFILVAKIKGNPLGKFNYFLSN